MTTWDQPFGPSAYDKGSLTGSWRVAARLARRDVAGAKARSALVVGVIMLASVAVWLLATFTSAPRYDSAFPTAFDGPRTTVTTGLRAPTAETLVQQLGPVLAGVPSLPRRTARRDVTGESTPASLDLEQVDATDPLWRGAGTLTAGRWPAARNEVALTGRALGSSLQVDGVGALTVVGTATFRLVPPGHAVVGPGTLDAVSTVQGLVLPADTPLGGGVPQALDDVTVRSDRTDAPDYQRPVLTSQVVIVGSAAALFGILQIALLAAAPFGVAARRQLRRTGLLLANGGSPADARRVLLAQALLLGSAGTVLGAAAGIPGSLAVAAARDTPFAGSSPALWPVVAVVIPFSAAVLAALVPAWTAARVPVTAALAGQRPSRAPRGWVPRVSAVLLVAGLVVLRQASHTVDYDSTDQTVKAVSILLGLVLCQAGATGLLVSIFAILRKVSGSLPVALRLALADADRARGRTIPAVLGVVSVVVVTASVLFAYDTSRLLTPSTTERATGFTLTAEARSKLGGDFLDPTVTPGTQAALLMNAAQLYPDALLVPVHPGYQLAVDRDGAREQGSVTVLDDAGAAGLGINGDALTAFRAGTVLTSDGAPSPGVVRLTTYQNDGTESGLDVPVRVVHLMLPGASAGALDGELLVPAALAGKPELAGIADEPPAVDVFLPRPVDVGVLFSHRPAIGDLTLTGRFYGVSERTTTYGDGTRFGLVLAVLAVPGLVALLLTVATTALAKTELDADLAVMAAVGAGPRTRRRLAGAHALVVVVAGEVVGLMLALVGRSVLGISTDTVQGQQVGALAVWLVLLPLVTGAVGVLTTRSHPRPA